MENKFSNVIPIEAGHAIRLEKQARQHISGLIHQVYGDYLDPKFAKELSEAVKAIEAGDTKILTEDFSRDMDQLLHRVASDKDALLSWGGTEENVAEFKNLEGALLAIWKKVKEE